MSRFGLGLSRSMPCSWLLALALLCGVSIASPSAADSAAAQTQCKEQNKDGLATQCIPAKSELARDEVIRIATFDSGFGGFFTAKSIEAASRTLQRGYRARFDISHYGDTENAPYTEKSPEQIAQFAAQGILHAFHGGARQVFIACNTASIQYDRIKEILDAQQPGLSANTVSIVDSSVAELKRQIETRFKTRQAVRVAILATPTTVKAQTYPKALARAFGVELPPPHLTDFQQERWYAAKGADIQSVNYAVTLRLPAGRTVEVYQLAPANWVEMIEHGAPASVKDAAVKRDLQLLTSTWKHTTGDLAWDVVGEFCTHYPVFDTQIREQALAQGLAHRETTYIQQGPLMADIFAQMMKQQLVDQARIQPLSQEDAQWLQEFSRPRIFITGDNVNETRELARAIFANDPVPKVKAISFKTPPTHDAAQGNY